MHPGEGAGGTATCFSPTLLERGPANNATGTCPDGQQAVPLRTFVVSAAGYVLRLASSPGGSGDDAAATTATPWLELEVPLASFSGALPFIENRRGALTHSVLSTKRFLVQNLFFLTPLHQIVRS